MSSYPPKRDRLYFIIRGFNSVKYLDTYLNIIISPSEFMSLNRSGYFEKFNLIFDNYIEQ